MEMWKSLCSAALRAANPTFPQPCQRLLHSLERTPETCRGVDAPGLRGHSPSPTERHRTKCLRQLGFGAIQARIDGNIGFRGNTGGQFKSRLTSGRPQIASAARD